MGLFSVSVTLGLGSDTWFFVVYMYPLFLLVKRIFTSKCSKKYTPWEKEKRLHTAIARKSKNRNLTWPQGLLAKRPLARPLLVKGL